jgi:hypothetical protein
MRIHVLTHVYDDPLLVYWIRHHMTFADKVTVLVDPKAPESTYQMVRSFAVEKVGYSNLPFTGLDDLRFNQYYEYLVKRAFLKDESDWLIVLDSDEFVFCADWQAVLTNNGVPILRPETGWQMFSEAFPSGPGQVYDEVKHGVLEKGVTKPIVVRAGAEPGWSAGRHESHGTPAVWTPEIVMAHFRNLGLETQLGRNNKNWQRLTEDNRVLGHGWQTSPEWTAKEPEVYQKRLAEALAAPEVVFPGVGQ